MQGLGAVLVTHSLKLFSSRFKEKKKKSSISGLFTFIKNVIAFKGLGPRARPLTIRFYVRTFSDLLA